MRQFWLACLCTLAVWSECQTAPPADAAALLEQGNKEYRSSHFASAAAFYHQYLDRYPDRPDVRVFLGAALLGQDETSAALAEADRALQLDDRFAKAYTLKGRIYNANQDWDLSRQYFAKALFLDPQDRETWYFSGTASYQGAQFSIAVREFQQAIYLGANQSRVYEGLGLAYEALDDVKNAQNSYQRAVELSPNDYRAHLAFGAFLFRQGRSPDSKLALERAFALAPNSVEVRFQLGRLLYHAGDFEQAAQILQGALPSNECRVHNLLARIFLALSKKGEEEQELASLGHCLTEPALPGGSRQSPVGSNP